MSEGKAAPATMVFTSCLASAVTSTHPPFSGWSRLQGQTGSGTGVASAAHRLVPIKQEQWTPEVCQGLWLDTEVRVRVHKVRRRGPVVLTYPSGFHSIHHLYADTPKICLIIGHVGRRFLWQQVHDVELHRFPVQLELLEPDNIAALL